MEDIKNCIMKKQGTHDQKIINENNNDLQTFQFLDVPKRSLSLNKKYSQKFHLPLVNLQAIIYRSKKLYTFDVSVLTFVEFNLRVQSQHPSLMEQTKYINDLGAESESQLSRPRSKFGEHNYMSQIDTFISNYLRLKEYFLHY